MLYEVEKFLPQGFDTIENGIIAQVIQSAGDNTLRFELRKGSKSDVKKLEKLLVTLPAEPFGDI